MSKQTAIQVYAVDNWWFRIYGKGFSVEPLKSHTILFTERNRHSRSLHFLGHCWKILT